jgi:hypothetical protein
VYLSDNLFSLPWKESGLCIPTIRGFYAKTLKNPVVNVLVTTKLIRSKKMLRNIKLYFTLMTSIISPVNGCLFQVRLKHRNMQLNMHIL